MVHTINYVEVLRSMRMCHACSSSPATVPTRAECEFHTLSSMIQGPNTCNMVEVYTPECAAAGPRVGHPSNPSVHRYAGKHDLTKFEKFLQVMSGHVLVWVVGLLQGNL